MKKQTLSFLLIIAFTSISWGDGISYSSNHKNVDYCFTLSNTNRFKDYVFVAVYASYYDYVGCRIIKQGDCIGNRFKTWTIVYAVKKDAVNATMQSICSPKNGDTWKYRNEITYFFLNGSKATISSVWNLRVYDVPAADLAEKAVDVLEIIPSKGNTADIGKVEDNNTGGAVSFQNSVSMYLDNPEEFQYGKQMFFEIKKTKVIYTYMDGTSEEKEYITQNQRPQTNRINLIFLAVPALSMVMMSGIVLSRRRKK